MSVKISQNDENGNFVDVDAYRHAAELQADEVPESEYRAMQTVRNSMDEIASLLNNYGNGNREVTSLTIRNNRRGIYATVTTKKSVYLRKY